VQKIGVIGRSRQEGEELPQHMLVAAREVGRLIAESSAVLVNGGMGGVMEESARGAKLAGGLTVGFLPGADAKVANPYMDLVFATGMGTMRNLLTARCCDSIIMIGGGVGTLNEVTIAYDSGVPVVVLEGSTGWSDRLRTTLYDEQYVDERRIVAITYAATPADAVAQAVARSSEVRRLPHLPAHTGWAGQ